MAGRVLASLSAGRKARRVLDRDVPIPPSGDSVWDVQLRSPDGENVRFGDASDSVCDRMKVQVCPTNSIGLRNAILPFPSLQ